MDDERWTKNDKKWNEWNDFGGPSDPRPEGRRLLKNLRDAILNSYFSILNLPHLAAGAEMG